MQAVLIESGGIVPLPRVGGALSHAVASIRNLPRHCQTGVCQAGRFGKRGLRRKEETSGTKYSLDGQRVAGIPTLSSPRTRRQEWDTLVYKESKNWRRSLMASAGCSHGE